MKQLIYADNAATTQLNRNAFEAMVPWLRDEYGNASQPYAFARKPKKALSDAREAIAECINAMPEEIYFTSGGTESDNWAVKGSAFFDPDKRAMITSAFEHHALLRSCEAIERLGYPVVYIMPTAEGIITAEALIGMISNTTRLVSVMYANNEIGTIQPIKELCDVAHSHGALFHTDAVQAVGHVETDVQKLGADMLSASAHKFNGPKGIGFLYIRKGTKILPYADGGAQESRYRAGTENIASIVGMATALKENFTRLKSNVAYIKSLEMRLLEELRETHIPFVRNGGDNTLPGLISLSFSGADGEAILHRMDLMGISISTGSACDNVNTEISHVLKAIQLEEILAKGTIRISLGRNNTEEDVDCIVGALTKVLRKTF
jgi:cysteine desulfurase